jgi:hypothetical protein
MINNLNFFLQNSDATLNKKKQKIITNPLSFTAIKLWTLRVLSLTYKNEQKLFN